MLIHQNLLKRLFQLTSYGKKDIDYLKIVPVDLHKLVNALKNDVVKNTVYDEVVKKFNAIQTNDASNLV